jgi:hypothetical protein
MIEVLLGLAAVALALGHVMRFAYNAGRADREVEKSLREDFDAHMANIDRRLALMEDEDATRRRQIHDIVEEFEEVVGPTHRERVQKLLQDTATARGGGHKTQRDRYGLGPRDGV